MVLYTHDSPFIKCRIRSAKKMTPEEFQKLVDKYRFGLTELTKFYKCFLKLQIDQKGIDLEGFTHFLAKFGNVDPTDGPVCRRLYEVINHRGNPTITFDQAIGLIYLLKPQHAIVHTTKFRNVPAAPANSAVRSSYHGGDPSQGWCHTDEISPLDRDLLVSKVNLFFDMIDTNGSGAINEREIRGITHQTAAGDRMEINKERRKMMVNKMLDLVFDKLGRDRHGTITRPELLFATSTVSEVTNFFAKSLFLAVNPWNH